LRGYKNEINSQLNKFSSERAEKRKAIGIKISACINCGIRGRTEDNALVRTQIKISKRTEEKKEN
jgi:hypothetical protein